MTVLRITIEVGEAEATKTDSDGNQGTALQKPYIVSREMSFLERVGELLNIQVRGQAHPVLEDAMQEINQQHLQLQEVTDGQTSTKD